MSQAFTEHFYTPYTRGFHLMGHGLRVLFQAPPGIICMTRPLVSISYHFGVANATATPTRFVRTKRPQGLRETKCLGAN